MGAATCCSKSAAGTSHAVLISKTESPSRLTTTTDPRPRRTYTVSEVTEFSLPDASAPVTRRQVKWRLGDMIGEGTYAKVYQCLSLEAGELLAVKMIRLSENATEAERTFEKVKNEIKLLRELSHKNIVRYIQTDVSEEGDCIHIVMEYISGGSLKTLVKKYSSLDEAIVRHYADQILAGLVYLHSHRIVHRDLKGANILLTPDGTIKLTDFGSSARLPGLDEVCLSMKGSPYWMAPEVVSREGHTTKADIWSFGCVLVEMRSGRPPWSDECKDTHGVLRLISTPGRIPHLPEASECFLSLITTCLERDPEKRPEAKDLLLHPFFAEQADEPEAKQCL